MRNVKGNSHLLHPILPSLFSIGAIGLTLAGALIWQSEFAYALAYVSSFVDGLLRWWYVALVAFLTAFVLWLGLGRYKNVRLGKDYEQPEYRLFPWLAMLFAAGTGVGLLFWSIAEPIMHFQGNPFTSEGFTPSAASTAIQLSFFHWGLNGWAIFALVAIAFGYFSYRQDLPLAPRSALFPLIGERIYGFWGHVVDALAVFATVFGLATTLGLGARQTGTGLKWLFSVEASIWVELSVVAVVTVIATISVVSGVRRGVKILSEVTLWLTLVLLAAFMLIGPFDYMAGLLVQEIGGYLDSLLAMTFYVGANEPGNWQSTWTVFFWGWWLAWSPFVGLFIARISRGRTLREFVFGVLLLPTLVTFVWISVMGGAALHSELFSNGGIVEAVNKDIAYALFATIEHMQTLDSIKFAMGLVATLLISIYFITSADSGALVVNIILSGGQPEPPKASRAGWAIANGVLTAVLLVAGGIAVLQDAVILAALPFSLVIVAMTAGLLKALHHEPLAAPREGCKQHRAAEPWTGADKP